ncbi:MAG: hypothetical protein R3298_02935 [Gammaproteobacteria bacterium]|nr:hypothetical protein [Gammaproteobacteria bacterium]
MKSPRPRSRARWHLLLPILGYLAAPPLHAIGNLGGYRSLGATDCTTYLEDYRAARENDGRVVSETGAFATHAGFILGYFSAFNAWVRNDIVDVTDGRPFERLYAMTADYCRAHPGDTLVQALEALVSEFWGNRDNRVGKPPWTPHTPTVE